MLRLFCISLVFSLCAWAVHKHEEISLELPWHEQFQFAGYYIAKEKGFYASKGLKVNINLVDFSRNMVDFVVEKEGRYGIGRTSLLLDYNHGKPVVALASLLQSSPLVIVVKEESSIKTIEDFKNKRILSDDDILHTLSIRKFFNPDEMHIQRDNKNPNNSNIQCFINGEVDAIVTYATNELYRLNQEGIKYRTFSPQENNVNFYSDILYTSQQEVQAHPQRVKDFREASLAGWKYAFEHIEETISLLLAKYNEQNKTREALLYEAKELKKLAYFKTKTLGVMTEKSIAKSYAYYEELEMLDDNISVYNFLWKDKKNFLSQLNNKERKYLKKKESIRMCINPKWMPFEMIYKNKHIGLSADYMHRLSQKIGKKIELIPSKTWTESLEKAKNGDCDILSMLAKNKERKSYLNFTEPYVTVPIVFSTLNSVLFIDNTESILDKKIAVTKNDIFLSLLKEKYPKIKLVIVDSIYDGLECVERGEVFAYVDNLPSSAYEIQKNFTSILHISGRFPFQVEYSIGSNIKQALLATILNKAIKDIDYSTRHDILMKWSKVDKKKENNYMLLFIFLVFSLVIIIAILYRKSILQKKYHTEKSLKLELSLLNHSLEEKVLLATHDLKVSQKQAKLGSWKLDIRRNILTWSDETYAIFELPKTSEIVNYQDFLDRIHPDDVEEVNQAYLQSLKIQEEYSISHRLLMPDGQIKYVKEYCETLFDIEGTPLISTGTIQDISIEYLAIEEMRYKDELIFRQSRLAQMGEMLTMIAHQWRQPLSAISAKTNTLIFKTELNQYEQEDYKQSLNKISEYTQHLSQTIEDFRSFFKQDKNKEEATIEVILDSVLDIMGASLESKNITIHRKILCHSPLFMYINEVRQVILNILKNAEDALIANEIKNPNISITCIAQNLDNTLLTIEDNAGGIHPSIIDTLFEPYITTKQEQDGTGLGLYMSKIMIEEHGGGLLSVRNTEKGACFSLSLPTKH